MDLPKIKPLKLKIFNSIKLRLRNRKDYSRDKKESFIQIDAQTWILPKRRIRTSFKTDNWRCWVNHVTEPSWVNPNQRSLRGAWVDILNSGLYSIPFLVFIGIVLNPLKDHCNQPQNRITSTPRDQHHIPSESDLQNNQLVCFIWWQIYSKKWIFACSVDPILA
jgi:hypothetical protein